MNHNEDLNCILWILPAISGFFFQLLERYVYSVDIFKYKYQYHSGISSGK